VISARDALAGVAAADLQGEDRESDFVDTGAGEGCCDGFWEERMHC